MDIVPSIYAALRFAPVHPHGSQPAEGPGSEGFVCPRQQPLPAPRLKNTSGRRQPVSYLEHRSGKKATAKKVAKKVPGIPASPKAARKSLGSRPEEASGTSTQARLLEVIPLELFPPDLNG